MKAANFYQTHKKFIFAIIVLLIIGFLLSKGSAQISVTSNGSREFLGASQKSMVMTENLSAESSIAMDSSAALPGSTEAKVIKTASLSLHMDDVRAKTDEIKTMLTGWGGYVGDASVNRYENSYSANMTLRVPENNFETAISALKELSLYVNSEYSNSSDVTLYYNDIEAKISNRKALEQQYLEILKKAGDLEGVAAITKALADVRSEIESFEIEKKTYDNQINYSTISVYMDEDASAEAASETWSPKTTWNQAKTDFVSFLHVMVDKGIYALVYGWPLLLLYVLYRIARRFRK